MAGPRLPAWRWAYAAFRVGDGASHAVIPLAVLVLYGMPAWAVAVTATAMNLASVPASFAWGRVMERGRGRRRIAVAGFLVAAVAMLVMALRPSFPVFLVAAAAFSAFGVATVPAAGLLVLEGRPRKEWGDATAALSRNNSIAYLVGFATTLALGLAGALVLQGALAVTAGLCAVAAVVAVATIPPFTAPVPQAPATTPAGLATSQRRTEGAVFMPSRTRWLPSLGALRRMTEAPLWTLMLALALLFMGTVIVFAGYPGVLDRELGLSVGFILLAQAPAQFLSPWLYPWSARLGARRGEPRAIAVGVVLRMVAVPGLCAAILFAGADGLPAMLGFHAVIGISFALLQVNAPCLAASLHPGGRGDGVGAYHAAVALGVLLGSALSFLALLLAPLWTGYLGAAVATTGGGLLALHSLRRLPPDAS